MNKTKKKQMLNVAWCGGLIAGLSYPALAADQLSLSVGTGIEPHDNAAHLDSNEKSDTRRFVSTDLGYKKTDGAIIADIAYSAERSDYLRDYDEDNTAIDGSTALTWLVAPRFFDVALYHQISQSQTDRRELDVASNRERRSIITAVANGYLHLSPVDSLTLSPRVSDVNFQDSTDSDSQRAGATLAWEHKLSAVSSLSLNTNYDHVTFDESANDYDTPSAMLVFQSTLSRLSYQIGLGANQLNRDEGEDFDGSTANISADYRSDEGQEWGASYVRQLTDNSVGLSSVELSRPEFNSNDSNFEEFDVIEVDAFDAYWRARIDASNNINAGIGYRKEDYQETPQDQNVAYAQLGYQYTINSYWSLGADARYERTKFVDDPEEKYNTTRLAVNAIYRVSRPLDVRLSVGQDKRSADDATSEYTDNFAMIGLNYRFF